MLSIDIETHRVKVEGSLPDVWARGERNAPQTLLFSSLFAKLSLMLLKSQAVIAVNLTAAADLSFKVLSVVILWRIVI